MANAKGRLLAGDIGGTKTKLVIFDRSGHLTPLEQATYRSADHPDLESIVGDLVDRTGLSIDAACFGVAGPVFAGRAKITNLPWTIEEARLAERLECDSVTLINDLQAIATAIPFLNPQQLRILVRGEPVQGGAIAVIAPGTGLGEAFLTWDGVGYRAHPCEGGHVDFAPTNDLEYELLQFLGQRYGHVSVERVCSGLGISNIYDFLGSRAGRKEPAWLAEKLGAVEDRTPVIMDTALGEPGKSALCDATLELFLEVLGRETGNMALKVMATGGVYLAGGIPPRMPEAFENGPFLRCFAAKGRFAEWLSSLPVHIVAEPEVAILGAARHAIAELGSG